MIIKMPKEKDIHIKNIVFDFNGTLAEDGMVSEKTLVKLQNIAKAFNVYVVTADTFHSVKQTFSDMDIEVHVISEDHGKEDKGNFIDAIGSNETLALGNGNNDSIMLERAVIGCSILGPEGLSKEALLASDLFVSTIDDFIKLIENPKKIIATLRK